MRELFDEVAGKSPLDPEEAVRRTTRGPQRKRFYTHAGVTESPDGFAITLDDKPVRTPSGRALAAPNRDIADAIAAEWDAQKEFIDPLTMPLTRFANSVVDAVVDRVEAVADDIAKYFDSDLLFYRAGHPEGLVAREAAHLGSRRCSGRRRRWARISSSPRGSCMSASPIRRSPRRARRCRRTPGRSRRCMWSRPRRVRRCSPWRCCTGVLDAEAGLGRRPCR